MMELVSTIRKTVRGIMFEIAKLLDTITDRKIRPNHITLLSLLGHVVLFLALIEGRFAEAALMLVFFGLLDSVDGELARYQKTGSILGGILDSTTDRFKEALIYAGLGYWFADTGDALAVLLTIFALGVSFTTSYVKAKAEVGVLEHKPKLAQKDINQQFGVGLFGYEVRMFALAIGFVLDKPLEAVVVVILGATGTLMARAITIYSTLK